MANSVSAPKSRPVLDERQFAEPPRGAAAAAGFPPATATRTQPIAPPPPHPHPRQSKAASRASKLGTKLLRVGRLLQRYRAASRGPAAATAGSPDTPTHGSPAALAATAAAACTSFGPSSPNPPLTAVRSASSIDAAPSTACCAAAGLPAPTSSALSCPADYSRGSLTVLLSEGARHLAPPHAQSQPLPLPLLLLLPPPQQQQQQQEHQYQHQHQQQQQQQPAFERGAPQIVKVEAARAVTGVAATAGCGGGRMTSSKGPLSLASLGGTVAARVWSYVSGGGGGGGIAASPWSDNSGEPQSLADAAAGEPSAAAASVCGTPKKYDTTAEVMGASQVVHWLRSIGARPGTRLTVRVTEWCDGGSLQHTLQHPHRAVALPGGRALQVGSPGAAAAAAASSSFLDAPPLRQYGVKSSGDAALGGGTSSSRSLNLATCSMSDDGTVWIAHPAPGSQQPLIAPIKPKAPPLSMLPVVMPAGGGCVPACLERWAARIAALRCAHQVAEALAHLHASGFYHSNLNPTTILCCRINPTEHDAPGLGRQVSASSGGGGGGQAAQHAAAPPPSIDTTSSVLERLIASTPLGRMQYKVSTLYLTPVAAPAAAAPPPPPPPLPSRPPPLPASPASVTARAPPGSGGGGSVVDDDPPAAASASIFTSLKAAAEAVATAPPVLSAGGGGAAVALKPSLELSLNTTQWGAIAYVAPELVAAQLDGGGGGTAAADLSGPAANAFAFGMLLWQLLSGCKPHFELHPAQILMGRLTGDVDRLLTWPEDACEALTRLGQACLERDPRDRPSMRCVAEVLSDVAAREAADCQSLLALHCG